MDQLRDVLRDVLREELTPVTTRLDKLEQRFDGLEQRFGEMDNQLSAVKEQLNRMEQARTDDVGTLHPKSDNSLTERHKYQIEVLNQRLSAAEATVRKLMKTSAG